MWNFSPLNIILMAN